MSRQRFDPYAILRELENPRTFFVVIGGLAHVIQGSAELTEGLDIAPSLSQENLRRLGRALENMNARRVATVNRSTPATSTQSASRWSS